MCASASAYTSMSAPHYTVHAGCSCLVLMCIPSYSFTAKYVLFMTYNEVQLPGSVEEYLVEVVYWTKMQLLEHNYFTASTYLNFLPHCKGMEGRFKRGREF